MKKSLKNYFLFCLIAAFNAVFFMSCASLPKTVKSGDTLVIGRVEVKAHDYPVFNGTVMNGTFHSNIVLEFTDYDTGVKRNIKPNKDGCFFIKNFKPNATYGITKVTYEVKNAAQNGGVSCFVNIPSPNWFTPVDNKVINLGCTYFDFDGSRNWVTWNKANHFYVKQFFQDLQDETEWYDKEIIDLR